MMLEGPEQEQRLERQRLFEQTKAELVCSQRANAEQFDRSILTLSTGFLALSISFMKDVVPFATSKGQWLLYLSWIAFAAAIGLTLFGLQFGQYIFKRLILAADRYYLKGETDAWKESERLPRIIDCLNWMVGCIFAVGVIFTVAFAVLNLSRNNMAQNNNRDPRVVERSQTANTFTEVAPPLQTTTAQPPAATGGVVSTESGQQGGAQQGSDSK